MNKDLDLSNTIYNFINQYRIFTRHGLHESNNTIYYTDSKGIIKYNHKELYFYDALVCNFIQDDLGLVYIVNNLEYIRNYIIRIKAYKNCIDSKIPFVNGLNFIMKNNRKFYNRKKKHIIYLLDILLEYLSNQTIDWTIKYNNMFNISNVYKNALSTDRILYNHLRINRSILEKHLIPNINNIIMEYIGKSL